MRSLKKGFEVLGHHVDASTGHVVRGSGGRAGAKRTRTVHTCGRSCQTYCKGSGSGRSTKAPSERCVVRCGAAKAASEGSLTVLDDERLPPCRCDPTLLTATFSQPALYVTEFCSKAAMNEAGIFQCLLAPHKRVTKLHTKWLEESFPQNHPSHPHSQIGSRSSVLVDAVL